MNNTNNKHKTTTQPCFSLKSRAGFTLAEMTVYIAIFIVSATLIVGIFFTFAEIYQRQTSMKEVNEQLSFINHTIQQLTRESSLIDIPSGEPTDTIILRMIDDERSTVLIYHDEDNQRIMLQEGDDDPIPVTDSNVLVSHFQATKYEHPGAHDTLQVAITMDYNSQNPRERFKRSVTLGMSRISAATFDSHSLPNVDNTFDLGNAVQRWRDLFLSGSAYIDHIEGDISWDGVLTGGFVPVNQLTTLGRNHVNNPTISGNINGWGNIKEDGSGSSGNISYNSSEQALQITHNGNYGVRSQAFEHDPNKIYRLKMRVRKSQSTGFIYLGLSALSSFSDGSESTGNQSGNRSISRISESRSVSGTGSNMYFYRNPSSGNSPTDYVDIDFYILGANIGEDEFPDWDLPDDNQYNNSAFRITDPDTPWIAVRILNWNNGGNTTSVFIRDISVTEVGPSMVVRNQGNVGIGTVNPNERLQVDGNVHIEDGNSIYINDLSSFDSNWGVGSDEGHYQNQSPLSGQGFLETAWIYANAIEANNKGSGTSGLYIGEHTGTGSGDSNELSLRTSGTNALTIDSNQRVGIGTINPGSQLDITGSMRIRGGVSNASFLDTPGQLAIKRSGSSSAYISFHESDGSRSGYLQIGDAANGVVLSALTDYDFRIDNQSRVLLGMASPFPHTEEASFQMRGGPGDTTQAQIAMARNTGSGGDRISMMIAQNSSDGRLLIRTGARVDGSQGFSGGVRLPRGATSWEAHSDISLKQNLRTIDSALEKIRQINGYYFDWKDEEHGDTQRTHVGLIAQELEKVLPEAVSTDEDGIKHIRYTETIPLLLQAIKEQQGIIDEIRKETCEKENTYSWCNI